MRVLLLTLAVAACAPTVPAADDASMDEMMTTNAAMGIKSEDPALIYARRLGEGTRGICDFGAYSNEPKGLDVRAGPSTKAPVLGRLPKHKWDRELEQYYGPDIRVLEARDGWFRISYEQGRRPLTGWVPGHNLGFDLQTDLAHAEPTVGSPIVATSWEDADQWRHLHWRYPSDCKGMWVKVRVQNSDGVERDGWANGVCASQVTTCDGARGEQLPR